MLQIFKMDGGKKVSNAGKRMLGFALQSALNHNQKNLAEMASKKNPSKLTIAEKEALQQQNLVKKS
jgi:hypothetical protein